MDVIALETVEADKVKEVVSKEEAIASEEAAKVQAIKSDCEADLAEAMPVLDKALKALNTLTKNDITEVKVCGTNTLHKRQRVPFPHPHTIRAIGVQAMFFPRDTRCLRASRGGCRA